MMPWPSPSMMLWPSCGCPCPWLVSPWFPSWFWGSLSSFIDLSWGFWSNLPVPSSLVLTAGLFLTSRSRPCFATRPIFDPPPNVCRRHEGNVGSCCVATGRRPALPIGAWEGPPNWAIAKSTPGWSYLGLKPGENKWNQVVCFSNLCVMWVNPSFQC